MPLATGQTFAGYTTALGAHCTILQGPTKVLISSQ